MEIQITDEIENGISPISFSSVKNGELFCNGKTVRWMVGKIPSQTLTFDSEIKCCTFAFFKLKRTNFALDYAVRALIVTTTQTDFYFDNGEHFCLKLGFDIRSMHALEIGLLIEREDKCQLYALMHPLEIIQEVHIVDDCNNLTVSPRQAMKFSGIINSNGEAGYITSFDCKTMMMSIYKIDSHELDGNDLTKNRSVYGRKAYEVNKPLLLRLKRTILSKSKPFKVFILRNNETPLVWIISLKENAILAISPEHSSETIWKYDILAAAPVFATRLDFQDILLLLPDHSLKLWVGDGVIPCSIKYGIEDSHKIAKRKHSDNFTQDKHSSPTRSSRVVNIESASGNEVIIEFSTDNYYRGILDFSLSNQLAVSCLQGLEYVLPKTLFQTFRYRLYKLLYKPSSNEVHRDEWHIFVMCFYSFFHSELNLSGNNDSSSENEAWKWLQNSHEIAQIYSEVPMLVKEKFRLDASPSNQMESIYAESHIVYMNHHTDGHLYDYIYCIVDIFHIIYEDMLLNTNLAPISSKFGVFMLHFTTMTGNSAYANCYVDDGITQHLSKFSIISPNLHDKIAPKRIFRWVFNSISLGRTDTSIIDSVNKYGKLDSKLFRGCSLLKQISELYKALYCFVPSDHILMLKVLTRMEDMPNFDILPPAVSIPLMQALFLCRESPGCLADSPVACRLIGRKDLESLHGQPDISQGGFHFDKTKESIDPVQVNQKEVIAILYAQNESMKTAESLLIPTADPVLDIDTFHSTSIEDISTSQQTALDKWVQKIFAVPVGRGMLMFESSTIVPTEIFLIPDIKKSARLPPVNALIEYFVPVDSLVTEWPEFHMGVATALQIRHDCKDVDSSWIVFNQSKTGGSMSKIDASHGGFILGLGLTGHLRKLDSADSLQNYFAPQNQVVSIGHLLGLAIAFMGSQNSQLTSMLVVHLPFMLPSDSIDLNTGSLLKAGAIFGYGLLYHSCHSKSKLDKIFAEIKMMEVAELISDTESNEMFLISSGFALGLIGLGCFKTTKVNLKGMVDELLKMLESSSNLHKTIATVVALGLIGLKSNSRKLADALSIPCNRFDLEFLTPERLLIQTICLNLIMWDEIQSTFQWISDQIPRYLSDAYNRKGNLSNKLTIHLEDCYFMVLAGTILAVGLRYAGTFHQKAQETILEFIEVLALPRADISQLTNFPSNYKRNCIIIAVTSLSLVMAGSCSAQILKKIQDTYSYLGTQLTYGSHMALNMALGLIYVGQGTCTVGRSNISIASLFFAFYPLYPSTSTDNRCHLQALRHMWVLAIEKRFLVTQEVGSGLVVKIPLQITMKNGFDTDSCVINQSSPCLLPPYEDIESVSISSKKYWNQTVPVNLLRTNKSFKIVCVQKKGQSSAHMNGSRMRAEYSTDGAGMLNNLISKYNGKPLSLDHSFTDNPGFQMYQKYMFAHKNDEPDKYSDFRSQVLYECMICQDNMIMIVPYLKLFDMLNEYTTADITNHSLALSLLSVVEYARQLRDVYPDSLSVINLEFCDYIAHELKSKYLIDANYASFVNKTTELSLNQVLRAYCETSHLPAELDPKAKQWFRSYMIINQWPCSDNMTLIRNVIADDPTTKYYGTSARCIYLRGKFNLVPIKTLKCIISFLNIPNE